jgi:glucosamine--fructose-6-phosphate aminotransferase (isomerizing)
VAIFKAHKASVVVFADEGERRFDGVADAVISIPRSPQPQPVILNTMAGHLWGYYAALDIDEEARLLREFRGRLTQCLSEEGRNRKGVSFYEQIANRNFRRTAAEFATVLNEKRQGGAFSVMNGNTLSDLVLLLKYVLGKIPLEDYWEDFKEDRMFSPVERLDICLGQAIDELARPVDAIRHQAKTVTVGTSRKEERLEGVLFDLIAKLSFTPRQLISRNVLAISRIQPAIETVTGFTLYAIDGLDADGNPTESTTISIVKRGGVSLNMPSRAERPTILIGTKRTLTSTGHVYVGKGKLDGAPLVIIPLLGEKTWVGNLLLVHVLFNENLPLREKIEVLGYKFNDIRNLINEYNLPWNDRDLADMSMEFLLSEPVETIAGRIKAGVGKRQTNKGE